MLTKHSGFLHYLILLLCAVACSVYDAIWDVNASGKLETDIRTTIVSESRLPLFANLDDFILNPSLRSTNANAQDSEEQFMLSDLLNMSEKKVESFKDYLLTAIPFYECYSGKVAMQESYCEPYKLVATGSKSYYVMVADTVQNTVRSMVITMIPHETYAQNHTYDEIDYLNKGDFVGLILYSDLDGNLMETLLYGGPLVNMEPVSRNELDNESCEDIIYVYYVPNQTSATTKDGSVELEAAICIAFRTQKNEISPDIHPNIGDDDNDEFTNDELSGGGGGKIDNGNSSEPQKFKVFLTAALDETGCEAGWVLNEGLEEYPKGFSLTCCAFPYHNFNFDMWAGDLSGMGQTCNITINSDISATAYFLHEGQSRPCVDASTGIGNPLQTMILAPTNSGNLENALFKEASPERNSGKHQGMDFAASIGTPIYAPYDGKVDIWTVTNVPAGHDNGDHAGNKLALTCTIGGKQVTFCFWHLQGGTPLGPYYRDPKGIRSLKIGDRVFRGEIIGYTGDTGNACNVDNKHLHLGVKDANGKWINPESYINGTVQRDESGRLQKEITNIKCDKIYQVNN